MRALLPILTAGALLVAASCFYDFNKSLGACVDAGGCVSGGPDSGSGVDGGPVQNDAGVTDAGASDAGRDAGTDSGVSSVSLTPDASWRLELRTAAGIWGDGTRVWVVGDGGVQRQPGPGLAFDTLQQPNQTWTAVSGYGGAGGTVWILGLAQQIGFHADDISNLFDVSASRGANWFAAAQSSDTVFIVGDSPTQPLLSHPTSGGGGGGAWIPVTDPSLGAAQVWTAAWIDSQDNLWMGSSIGSVGTNDGGYWALDSGVQVNALWGDNQGSVFAAVGLDVWRFWDGGWASSDTAPQTLTAIWGTAPNDVWSAGGAGVLRHFNGGRWTAIDAGWGTPPPDLTGIWGNGTTDLWLCGNWDGGMVFRFLRQ